MKVLIACEESQTVCKAFRALGYEAYSCDVQERDRQRAKAQALSPFSNPRFNRYVRHNKEREV